MSDYKISLDINTGILSLDLGFKYARFRYMAAEILRADKKKGFNFEDRISMSEIIQAVKFCTEHFEAVSLGIDKVVFLVYLFYLKEKFAREFEEIRKKGKDYEYWFINVSVRDAEKFRQEGMTESKIMEDFYLEKNLTFNNIAWEYTVFNQKTKKQAIIDPRYIKERDCYDVEKQAYKIRAFRVCSKESKALIKKYEEILVPIRKSLNTRSKFHIYETALSTQQNKLYKILTRTNLKDSSEASDLYEEIDKSDA